MPTSTRCERCGRTLDEHGLCPNCTLMDPADSAEVSASISSAAISASGEFRVTDGVVVEPEPDAEPDEDRDDTMVDGFSPNALGPVATPADADDVAITQSGAVDESYEVFRHQSVHQAVARVKELAPTLAAPNKRPALIMAATAIARSLLVELQKRDAWCGVIRLHRDAGTQDFDVTCTIEGEFVEKRSTAV